MQTFIPYGSDFRAAAQCLDDKRLTAQCKEAAQILAILKRTAFAKGYRAHPIVKMWRGYEPALCTYGIAMCDEFAKRFSAIHSNIYDFEGYLLGHGRISLVFPDWVYHPSVIASHRAALLHKLPEHYRKFFPVTEPKLDYLWFDPASKRYYYGQLSKPETVRWHTAS